MQLISRRLPFQEALRCSRSSVGRKWAEARVTGVQFDAFWDACVFDEIAYFFSWFGSVRSTVLVVFEVDSPIYVEVRRAHDIEVVGQAAEPPICEVLRLFDGRFPPCAVQRMH